MTHPSIDDLIENFSLLENWEDKYRYIIELANFLPDCGQTIQKPEYQISGCVSQVWLKIIKSDESDPIFTFCADADSHMVKGLLYLVLIFYQNKSASWIKSHHPQSFFEQLNLQNNLTRQRTNGLNAFIQAIQKKNSKCNKIKRAIK